MLYPAQLILAQPIFVESYFEWLTLCVYTFKFRAKKKTLSKDIGMNLANLLGFGKNLIKPN